MSNPTKVKLSEGERTMIKQKITTISKIESVYSKNKFKNQEHL